MAAWGRKRDTGEMRWQRRWRRNRKEWEAMVIRDQRSQAAPGMRITEQQPEEAGEASAPYKNR